jgi:hypothetical protein
MADREGVAVLIIAHTAKASGSRAIHAMLGSVDIAGAMRSIMMIGTPPDNREQHALLLVKHSVGPWAETLDFRIVKAEGKRGVRVEWRGTSNLTFADMVAAERPKNKSQVERAREWLKSVLTQAPHLVKDLAASSEFSERVLQKASEGLVAKHRRGGKHGPWEWSLLPPVCVGRKFAPDPRPPREPVEE